MMNTDMFQTFDMLQATMGKENFEIYLDHYIKEHYEGVTLEDLKACRTEADAWELEKKRIK